MDARRSPSTVTRPDALSATGHRCTAAAAPHGVEGRGRPSLLKGPSWAMADGLSSEMQLRETFLSRAALIQTMLKLEGEKAGEERVITCVSLSGEDSKPERNGLEIIHRLDLAVLDNTTIWSGNNNSSVNRLIRNAAAATADASIASRES